VSLSSSNSLYYYSALVARAHHPIVLLNLMEFVGAAVFHHKAFVRGLSYITKKTKKFFYILFIFLRFSFSLYHHPFGVFQELDGYSEFCALGKRHIYLYIYKYKTRAQREMWFNQNENDEFVGIILLRHVKWSESIKTVVAGCDCQIERTRRRGGNIIFYTHIYLYICVCVCVCMDNTKVHFCRTKNNSIVYSAVAAAINVARPYSSSAM